MAQIEIKNVDKLIKQLKNITDEGVQRSLEKSCLLVENAAKKKITANHSVDDGQLRNSITHEIEKDVGLVGTNTEYAPYVEIGTGLFSSKGNGRSDVPWRYKDDKGHWHTTVGQHPKPFLLPALEENRGKIIKIFEREMESSK